MKYLWLILLFVCTLLQAQKHDNNWLMGGNCVLHPDFSIATLDFQKLTNIPRADSTVQFVFESTNTAMSDRAGRLQFYTNGNEIYNYLHEPLKNGERLEFEEDCEGVRNGQGAFCVPHGEHSDQYNLFTISSELLFEGVDIIGRDQRIYYNVVDMNANNGEGELIVRRDLMLQDTLNSGQGMLCQHANGRDWWLLLFETDSNRYYRFLIDTEGYHDMGSGSIEMVVLSGRSQVAYSPDGNYYAAFNTINAEEGAFLSLFSFDRCSGFLSKQKTIPVQRDGPAGGLAFSPNSRFLYVSSRETLYQYDLWSEDVEGSRFTIGHWDGFREDNFWDAAFHTMQLAIDHKIYMGTTTSGHFIHVIHDPNKKGLACNFEQRGLEWPSTKDRGIPNFPYYRMGALEGSGCDTLGIDNGPIANFSYSVPESDALAYSFEDMTLREPISWSWDFGDGAASQEQHPGHEYSAYGSYQVTLVTNNTIGADTFRRNVCVYPAVSQSSYVIGENTALTCENDEIVLSATMAGEPLSDYPHFRSRWMLGPDSVIAMNENSIRVDIAGTYRLDILDTIYGCRIIDTIQITSNMFTPDFDLVQSADTIACEGIFEVYIDSEAACFEVVVYRDGLPILSSMEDTLSIQGAGDYVLELIDCESRCVSSQPFTVEHERITADFSFEEEGRSVSYFSLQEMNVTHDWDFGDGDNSTEQNPVHDYEESGTYEVIHIVTNTCGSDTLRQTIQVLSTSTNSLVEEGVHVFPNPTSDFLYITSQKNRIKSVRLFSSIGQEVISEQGASSSELNLSTKDLSPGVYLLDIELSNGKRLQEKVLVLKD